MFSLTHGNGWWSLSQAVPEPVPGPYSRWWIHSGQTRLSSKAKNCIQFQFIHETSDHYTYIAGYVGRQETSHMQSECYFYAGHVVTVIQSPSS